MVNLKHKEQPIRTDAWIFGVLPCARQIAVAEQLAVVGGIGKSDNFSS